MNKKTTTNKKTTNGWARLAMSALMVAALAACGGGGSSGASSSGASSTGGSGGTGAVAEGDSPNINMTTVHGVAATGAPIVGGMVELKCASGATASATTDAEGLWSASLKDTDYPCVARVPASQGPTVSMLHSVVAAPGVTNITPITDLIVGILSGQDPATWFAHAANGTLIGAITPGALSDALDKLKTTLATLPGKPALPDGFDPLTSAFNAKKGDVGDDFLESFGAALAASGLTQAEAAKHAGERKDLTLSSLVLKVYTTPNMTSAFGFRGGLSFNLDGQTVLSIPDPHREAFKTPITLALASSDLAPTGFPFTGGISPIGGAAGQLCTAGAGAFNGERHSQYVYVAEGLEEVTDLNELKGLVFDDYEDCQKTGTLTVRGDGSAVFEETGKLPDEPDTNFLAAFTTEGREETNNGVTGVARAKAFKYTINTGTYYIYVGVSNKKGDTSLDFNGDPTYVTMGVSRQFD